jgi:hypothetical protein
MEVTTNTLGLADRGENVPVNRGTCIARAPESRCGVLPQKYVRHRGIALIWAAIFLMLIILLLGLMLDTGKVALNIHQLQNAADAAALAGAQYVKTNLPEFVRQTARDMGLQNAAEGFPVSLRLDSPQPAEFPTGADGSYDFENYDIVVGRWVTYNQTFLPTLDAPNAVLAIARRNTALAETGAPALGLIWGPIAGVDTADAETMAIGFCMSSAGAGLIVLSSDPTQTLDMGGGPTIDLDGGGIHINSTSDDTGSNWAGARAGLNTQLDAGFLNVVGTIDPPPDDAQWEAIFANAEEIGAPGGFPVMDYSDGVQLIDDPLAAAMLADAEALPYVVPFSAEGTQTGPGARLNLPALLDTEGGIIPTRLARWNSSSSGYDLISPADPSVKMQWNGSSHDQVPADPGLDDPSTFHHTVGMVGDIVTDPNTGLPVLDPVTGLPTYSEGNGQVTATLPPGYYPNGMRLTTGDDVTLAQSSESGPGTFFIWGGDEGAGGTDVGLVMNAGSLTGYGVTCYVTQNFDSGAPGVLKITGGYLDIDSPGDRTNQENGYFTPSLVEGLNGISIWQDPAALDPSTGLPPEAHLNGNGDFYISGTPGGTPQRQW